jgi:hypothetical protein
MKQKGRLGTKILLAGSCEHGNGSSGSVKGEQLRDQLNEHYFLGNSYYYLQYRGRRFNVN